MVARYLGPDEYGTFNVARAFASIFILAAPLGIPNILTREIVRKPAEKFELIGSTIAIRLISAVVLYIIMVVLSIVLHYSRLEIALISILGVSMIGMVFDTIDNYLQAIVKLKSSSKIRLIGLIIGSILKLILIYLKAPIIAFAWVFTLEFILIAIGFIVIYRKYGHHFNELSVNFKILKPILLTSLPLLYYTILSTINMKIDQLMIDRILVDDPAANGYYAVVVGLVESLYFIPVALGTSLFPGLVKQRDADINTYNKMFVLLYEILLIISIGVAVVFFVGAPLIIRFLYGEAYTPAIPIMKLYAFCPILIFYGSMRSRWLIIQDLHKYSIWFLVASILVNVTLNRILLPTMGPEGAVVAILASYFTAFLIVPAIITSTRPSVTMFFQSFLFKEIRERIKNKSI